MAILPYKYISILKFITFYGNVKGHVFTIIARLKSVSINKNYLAKIVTISELDLGYICSNSNLILCFTHTKSKLAA